MPPTARDLNFREVAILLPIAAACLVTGLYPRMMLDVTEPSVREALISYPERVNQYNAEHGKVNPSAKAKVAAITTTSTEAAR